MEQHCFCVCAYVSVVIFIMCVSSLEVNLQKCSEGSLWAELVLGDKRGQYISDEEQAAQLHQRLTYLTAEELVCYYFLPHLQLNLVHNKSRLSLCRL